MLHTKYLKLKTPEDVVGISANISVCKCKYYKNIADTVMPFGLEIEVPIGYIGCHL